ncbi:hypothetical protein ACVWZV_004443 [Bradyrhizobium sp. GM5.1]
MSGPTQSFTVQQAAAQITRNDYHWSAATISFGFRTSPPGYNDSNGVRDLIGTFSGFTGPEQAAARLALDLWSSVANISFNDIGNTNNAAIEFSNYYSKTDNSEAAAYLPQSGNRNPGSSDGDVFFNTYYASTVNDSPGSYEFQAFIHEIGHALGLQHPGDYNAGPSVVIDPFAGYSKYAAYMQDDRQYTIMSYFSETNTGANFFGSQPETPLLHDIAAIQRLYGANLTTRTGNTTYGYNTTSDIIADFKQIYDFSINKDPVYCIYDAGGVNTLDCSLYGGSQLINLHSGAFSSVLGLVDNLSIAANTVVQVAIGGSGNDKIVSGGSGEVLTGGGGADAFVGTMSDLSNDTIIDFSTIDDLDITDLGYANPLTVGPYSFASYDPTTGLLNVSGLGAFSPTGVKLHVNSPQAGQIFTVASDGNGGTLVQLAANTGPQPPAPSEFALAQDSFSTQSHTIAIVNTPTITGTGGYFGDTITLYDGSTVVGTGTAGFVGGWYVTCNPLSEGLHTLTAKQTDPSTGATSAGSATFTFLVDTQAPVVSITSTGGVTSQKEQTISGTIDIADARSTVLVYDETIQVGAAKTNASGQWSTNIST